MTSMVSSAPVRVELGSLAGRSVLITGASGFIGRSISESIMRFKFETSPAAPCTLTLPTRSPEVLLARYGSQVEAGEVRVRRAARRLRISILPSTPGTMSCTVRPPPTRESP